MRDLFSGNQFLIKKKIFKVFGQDFTVYDENEEQVLFAHLKAFRWKEDITLYRDDTKEQPLLHIRARQIIDFSAAYDFIDATSGKKIGAAKRRGFASLLKDKWILMDADDRPVGKVEESSDWMAFVRRFISALFPEKFTIIVEDQYVGTYKYNFNPFTKRMTFIIDHPHPRFSKAFGIGMGILLTAIEGKSED